MCIGKFIVLEGIDCTGKTTVASLVKQQLEEKGQNWIHIRCPDDTPGTSNAKIRELIFTEGNNFSKDAELMLFSASTIEQVHKVIIPALQNGINVICERYTLSTRVYQGKNCFTCQIVNWIEQQLTPDMIILLDITPEVYLERMSTRETIDFTESLDLDVINKRRNQYRLQLRKFAGAVTVDATRPLTEVVSETIKCIEMSA